MNDDGGTRVHNHDFSLVSGGPCYRLLACGRLIEPSLGWTGRRIAACSAVTWLPLAALTLLSGTFSGGVDVPFLCDLANLRFILALPLLINAEKIVHHRIRLVVPEFRARKLIAPEDEQRFDSLIHGALRARNWVAAEVVLMILAYTAGYLVWEHFATLATETWYATVDERVMKLTLAGTWLAYISLPVARFIMLRWYYRFLIWYWFIWNVSRLPLRLDPLHPDRTAGLGFLKESAFALAVVLMAQSVLVASLIGDKILYLHASLLDFQLDLLSYFALSLLVTLLPLLFFCNQLTNAKLHASRQFGVFAGDITAAFRKKWLQENSFGDRDLLDSPDIRTLASLSRSFSVVDDMRVVPFDKEFVFKIAILIALPLAPLLLTTIPLTELSKRLIELLI